MGQQIAQWAGSMCRTQAIFRQLPGRRADAETRPAPSVDQVIPRRLAPEANGISEAWFGQQAKFLIDDCSPMSARHGVGGVTTFPSTRSSRLHQSRVLTNAF